VESTPKERHSPIARPDKSFLILKS
jgi:hypothetical protein